MKCRQGGLRRLASKMYAIADVCTVLLIFLILVRGTLRKQRRRRCLPFSVNFEKWLDIGDSTCLPKANLRDGRAAMRLANYDFIVASSNWK